MSKPKDFIAISFRLRWGNPKFGGGVKTVRYEDLKDKNIEGLKACFKEFIKKVIWDTDFIDWSNRI